MIFCCVCVCVCVCEHCIVVQTPQGQTTVVYADNPYYYNRRYYDGSDVAMGMVAGAALGTMMWGPLLWW